MSTPNTSARFWAQVERSAGCWPWTGSVNPQGYGNVRLADERGSHRIAYTLSRGAIPAGLLVRHLCHNTRCCNPAHLEIGDHSDNMLDSLEAGRRRAMHAARTAPLSAAEVARARARVRDGETQADVAAEIGITPSSMSRIVNGKRWAWVGPDLLNRKLGVKPGTVKL